MSIASQVMRSQKLSPGIDVSDRDVQIGCELRQAHSEAGQSTHLRVSKQHWRAPPFSLHRENAHSRDIRTGLRKKPMPLDGKIYRFGRAEEHRTAHEKRATA